jgi:hypothetical protein
MLRAKEEAEIQLREECEQCIKEIKHEKEESEWQWKEESECHVKEALMEARIEEERQRDLRRTLEGEAADLRAMLAAVEQASTDAEARHTESLNQLTKVLLCILTKSLQGKFDSFREWVPALSCLFSSKVFNYERPTLISNLYEYLQ